MRMDATEQQQLLTKLVADVADLKAGMQRIEEALREHRPQQPQRAQFGSRKSLTLTNVDAAGAPRTKPKFAAFMSHAKAEAAMEARFVQAWLEQKLEASIFLDSDDLRDLTQLTQHVRDSDVLVLIQSQNVLTRPYCLLELLTAIKEGVPIIGLCLGGVTAHYNFAEAQHFLTSLDSNLQHHSPDAVKLLAAHGYDDLTEAAYLLSTVVPARISVPFSPGASASAISATLEDLTAIMAEAVPVDLKSLPPMEQWQRARSAKSWGDWTETLADHRKFLSMVPLIYGAYIGPHSLQPQIIESCMLTCNSVGGTAHEHKTISALPTSRHSP